MMSEGPIHPLDETAVAKLNAIWALDHWGPWHIRDLEAFRSFARTLGKSMSEASTTDLNAHLAPLKGGYHEHARRTLRLFFEEVRAEGRIKSNPVDLVRQKPRQRAVPLKLSREEVRNWLDYLKQCSQDENRGVRSLIEHARIWMIHELVYATGITINQILNFRRSDLCKNPPSVLIDAPEGKRRIPITKAAYRAIHHFEFLFIGYVGDAGEWILSTQQDLSKRCYAGLVVSGLQSVISQAPEHLTAKISTDAIRFASAAHLVESGMSSTDLAFISGLSRPGFFERKYPTLFA